MSPTEPTDPSDSSVPRPRIPGLRFLEHTADVGLEARAPTAPELFERAALGMVRLLVGDPPEPAGERSFDVEAPDLPILLRAWLRAVLRWHEDGLTASRVAVTSLRDAGRSRARSPAGRPASIPCARSKA
jgi:SHS2 domain-containing protein